MVHSDSKQTEIAQITPNTLLLSINGYQFYHTNANFIDSALIQALGVYSRNYGNCNL